MSGGKEYPEHEKAGKVKEQSQAIGEFLDWLSSEAGIVLCEGSSEEFRGYYPTYRKTDALLAEYFGIDLNRLEEEKRAMLKLIRESTARANVVIREVKGAADDRDKC